MAVLVAAFVYSRNAPFQTLTHWTRDDAGALLTVGTYANPDYWAYWRAQRVLAWTGGVLVVGGITWCFIWSPRFHRRWCNDHHVCPQCAYDLRGRKGLGCSECGWQRSGEHHEAA